jgi:hypothetical protein
MGEQLHTLGTVVLTLATMAAFPAFGWLISKLDRD